MSSHTIGIAAAVVAVVFSFGYVALGVLGVRTLRDVRRLLRRPPR